MTSGLSLNLESFDQAMSDRAVPPGSLRYFSLLYAPAEKRDVLNALYVMSTEIQDAARSANHDVAHTRLVWWRAEIDRLVNANAQHPATRLLQPLRTLPGMQLAILHELVVAADMDLARMTFANEKELRSYTERSGGVLLEAAARWLAAPAELSPETLIEVRRLGSGVRETEILRDVRQDAVDGLVYLPLALLDSQSVAIEKLRGAEISDAYRKVLREFSVQAEMNLKAPLDALSASVKPILRPLIVLADLHRRLLKRIASVDFQVATQRVELGSLEKVWGSWRAARKAA